MPEIAPQTYRTRRRGKDSIPLDPDLAVALVVSKLLESIADVAEYAARKFDERDELDDSDPDFLPDDEAYHFARTLRGIAWNCSNGASMLNSCTVGDIKSESNLLLGDLAKIDAIFDELFPDDEDTDEEEADEPTAIVAEGGVPCS